MVRYVAAAGAGFLWGLLAGIESVTAEWSRDPIDWGIRSFLGSLLGALVAVVFLLFVFRFLRSLLSLRRRSKTATSAEAGDVQLVTIGEL